MALQVGDKAPDFSGEDQFSSQVRLDHFLGKWRLMMVFYAFDWSPISARIVADLKGYIAEFRKLGIKVIGISVDSVFSHREWAKKHNLEFPLLSDFTRKISEDYKALDPKGFAHPTIFVIDKDGTVIYRKILLMGEKPSYDNIIQEIRDLIN